MSEHYQNFKVAIYARAYEVQKMADLDWLKQGFEMMQRHIRVDKVYLETHRDWLVAEESAVRQARDYLLERGVQVSGGITVTVNEPNRFQTYCYTNPEHRQKLKDVVTYTARLFDEVILDDFFFTNCKCPSCVAAKGDRSWTEFRLGLMADAARDLVLAPARAANPAIKFVIKYPNWYEHFQGLGFNLELEPSMFDGIYTGTETRDAVLSNQHLQPYTGYLIFRYFEAIKPGGNGGGWVDPFGARYADRYAEQLWLTLFAKAPEVTLFDFRNLLRPIEMAQRGPWQGGGTSFDFDAMIASVRREGEFWPADATIALAAGRAFAQVDEALGALGNPIGVRSYKPFHSTGEDFLHNYLGMLGIPIDLRPEFPADAPTMLLTEAAKHDPAIVGQIKQALLGGKTVVITSGLLRALQDRGLRDIVELEVTDRKASVQDFLIGWGNVYHADAPILIPHIAYLTNDSWEEVSGLTQTTGHPVLHVADYGGGKLYVLTIPDNFDDLYKLPEAVLARIRDVLLRDLPVRVDAPAQVMLFAYDNDTCIIASNLPTATAVRVVVDRGVTALRDVQTGEVIAGGVEVRDWRGQPTGKIAMNLVVKPHSYRVLRLEAAV